MNQVWLELKYGTRSAGLILCRLRDPALLRAFAAKALDEAQWKAHESGLLDPILGLIDSAESDKLARVLQSLIPSRKPDLRSGADVDVRRQRGTL
jgi:hypothetical protein